MMLALEKDSVGALWLDIYDMYEIYSLQLEHNVSMLPAHLKPL